MTTTAPRPETTEPDAPASFYVTGGTLGAGAPSYVERRADRDLLAGLTSGEYCYVLNSRQMGKSSLCVRTMARLRELGRRTCFLDLTKFGGRNLAPDQWYAALLAEAGRELGLRPEMLAFWKQNADLGPMQRFFGALQQVALPADASPLTVFVDEIDVTRGLPFSADEFFAGVRQCYVGRATDGELNRLTFCLLGTATPADLIQDTRTSPFNIGRRVEVKDFATEEAQPLAQGLGANGPALLQRVLYWTGGHPYLTQRLCRAAQEDGAKDAAEVDQLCSDLFLTRTAAEADDNLMFVRNRLLKSEADLAGLLDLYGQMRRGRRVPDDEADPLCAVLKLSGVARSEGGVLTVRNRIYEYVFSREWIVEHTPGAELRRQREAYRRGLARAGAIAGCVLVLLCLLAGWALVERSAAQRALGRAQSSDFSLQSALGQKEQETQQALHETRIAQASDREAQAQKSLAGRQTLLAQANAREAITEKAQATQKAQLAQQAQAAARIAATQANANALRAERETGKASDATKQALAQKDRADREAYGADMNLIQSEYENNNISHALQILKETNSSPYRGFEWGYWDRMCHISLLTIPVNSANSASFSPDGTRLVTVTLYGIVQVWDARTGAPLKTLQGRRRVFLSGDLSGVLSASFSPDGTRVVAVSHDGTVQAWDARTGARLKPPRMSQGHHGAVLSASFSPDGTRLVIASHDGTVQVWDARTGAPVWTLQIDAEHPGDDVLIPSVSFSPDGTRLVTASEDESSGGDVSGGFARSWDARTGAPGWTIKEQNGGAFCSLSFSRDGTRIVTATYDGMVQVWDARTGAPMLTFRGHTGAITSASFSPDGTRLVTAGRDGIARVWDAQTGDELITLKGHTGWVFSASFSPDGTRLVTAGQDGTVRVWDAQVDRQALTLRGHTGWVLSASFSPDGTRLVTAGEDRIARVWNVRTGALLKTLPGHTDTVIWASYSPDGTRIVTAGRDGIARVWDARTGVPVLTLRGHTDHVESASYSPDGTRIVTASFDKTARVWDAQTGTVLLALPVQAGRLSSASFSPDGTRVVTASLDGTVRVWDAHTGVPVLTLPIPMNKGAVNSASFSPDGTRIVTAGDDGTVRVWDTRTGALLLTLWGHTGAVYSASFSPDGTRIVTAGDDDTVRVWDAQTGTALLALPVQAGRLSSASFSPDGTRIVTVGENGTAKIWFSDLGVAATAPAGWKQQIRRTLARVRAQEQSDLRALLKRQQADRQWRDQHPAQPLEAAGYNAGLIAGGRHDASSPAAALASVRRTTTTTLDGAWDYYARGFNPAAPNVGLPVRQTFASRDDPSVRFRLCLSGKSNALLLTDSHATGTLTLAHPGRFRRLALLVTGAVGDHHDVRVRLNFAGGTSVTEAISVPDNLANDAPNVALSGFGRVCGTAHPNDETANPGGFDGAAPANPTLFDVQIVLPRADVGRTLTSITFTKHNGVTSDISQYRSVAVFGLSGG